MPDERRALKGAFCVICLTFCGPADRPAVTFRLGDPVCQDCADDIDSMEYEAEQEKQENTQT